MKKEMNILTASLPSDASEAEQTVLTEQVMQLGKNTCKNCLDEEMLMICSRSCS